MWRAPRCRTCLEPSPSAGPLPDSQIARPGASARHRAAPTTSLELPDIGCLTVWSVAPCKWFFFLGLVFPCPLSPALPAALFRLRKVHASPSSCFTYTWTARMRGLVPEPRPNTSTGVPGGRGRPEDTTRPRSDQLSLELWMSRCPSSSSASSFSSPHSPPPPPPSPVVACLTGLVCPWACPPAPLPYGMRACARVACTCVVWWVRKRIGAFGRRHTYLYLHLHAYLPVARIHIASCYLPTYIHTCVHTCHAPSPSLRIARVRG